MGVRRIADKVYLSDMGSYYQNLHTIETFDALNEFVICRNIAKNPELKCYTTGMYATSNFLTAKNTAEITE